MIRKYIEKISETQDKDKMEKLADVLTDSLYDLKTYNKEKYEKYKNEIVGMAYDYVFPEEMAEEIVENMTDGEVWDMDTVKQVMQQNGINKPLTNFYVVLNAMGNDYDKVIPLGDVKTYVGLTNAFIDDDDAVENKVWEYFTKIAK